MTKQPSTNLLFAPCSAGPLNRRTRWDGRSSLVRLARLLGPFGLGAVFLLASLSKAANPTPTITSFASVFGLTHMQGWAAIFALIAVEMCLAVMLLTRVAVRPAIVCTFLLLIAMSGYLMYLRFVNLPVSCGCMFTARGGSGPTDIWLGLTRNIALLALATISYGAQAYDPIGSACDFATTVDSDEPPPS